MRYYGGVDLGASNTRAVVGTTEANEILGTAAHATPQGPSGIDVTEGVLDALRHACQSAGISPNQIEAVGVGSFGPFDLAEGTIVSPANLPASVDRIPIVGPIEQLVDSDRVYLHNDTTAGVIGERFHADRNPDDMVYLTISTGIGAGVAVDGHILAGWDGNAGEVGHYTVDPEGRLTCGCGLDGHWEAYTSGGGIPRYTCLLGDELDLDGRTELPVEDGDFGAAEVFAKHGEDPLADEVIERLVRWNAIGLADVIHSYAPLVVSIGGAVALNNVETVVEPLEDALPKQVFTNVPEVKPTELGEDVVLHGALASAMTGGTGDRSHARW